MNYPYRGNILKAYKYLSFYNYGIRRNSSVTCDQSISKILIANRGEIACRVIKTARKMGIETASIFSEPDRNSLHVKSADEAFYVGPAAVNESYLCADKILEVARLCGASAVHPGYGFLSENAEFAESCEKNGISFIGPPSSAIRNMGIKSTSKFIMSEAGVPIIGGYHGEDQNFERLLSEAQRIGFPVMLKAVRGGGGKGMRISLSESDFKAQLESAKTEAMKSFGDDIMLVEKFIQKPRHVEVQVFGDKKGNYVYLYERDCSVQRRHQKIIEEAPAPGISASVRRELGEAAVRAANAVDYVGAGTVEFIMDADCNFYFMEMNTRLQVEHPITEMVTGVDLVEWQIRVARGESLPMSQEEIPLNGHSFEGRIYAEDPDRSFLPGVGVLKRMITPVNEPDLRIETGVIEGDEVSVHYDPMIAKLVVWGPDRNTALAKFVSALSNFNIVGVCTNINFLMRLSLHPEFQLGNVHTDFIPCHEGDLFQNTPTPASIYLKAALALILNEKKELEMCLNKPSSASSPFTKSSTRRLNHEMLRIVNLEDKNKDVEIRVTFKGANKFSMTFENNNYDVSGELRAVNGSTQLTTNINQVIGAERVVLKDDEIHVFAKNGSHHFLQPKPSFLERLDKGHASSGSGVSPMPGVVEKVCVKVGDSVEAGTPLMVIIAMKMEFVIKATSCGVVEEVLYKAGDNVSKDTKLVKISSNSENSS